MENEKKEAYYAKKEQHLNECYVCTKVEFRTKFGNEFAVVWTDKKSKQGKDVAVAITKQGNEEFLNKLKVGMSFLWNTERTKKNRIRYAYKIIQVEQMVQN